MAAFGNTRSLTLPALFLRLPDTTRLHLSSLPFGVVVTFTAIIPITETIRS